MNAPQILRRKSVWLKQATLALIFIFFGEQLAWANPNLTEEWKSKYRGMYFTKECYHALSPLNNLNRNYKKEKSSPEDSKMIEDTISKDERKTVIKIISVLHTIFSLSLTTGILVLAVFRSGVNSYFLAPGTILGNIDRYWRNDFLVVPALASLSYLFTISTTALDALLTRADERRDDFMTFNAIDAKLLTRGIIIGATLMWLAHEIATAFLPFTRIPDGKIAIFDPIDLVMYTLSGVLS